MIHGMWGGQWNWDNYKKLFEKEGYNCVTTTLRFHDIDPKEIPDSKLGTTGLLAHLFDFRSKKGKIFDS